MNSLDTLTPENCSFIPSKSEFQYSVKVQRLVPLWVAIKDVVKEMEKAGEGRVEEGDEGGTKSPRKKRKKKGRKRKGKKTFNSSERTEDDKQGQRPSCMGAKTQQNAVTMPVSSAPIPLRDGSVYNKQCKDACHPHPFDKPPSLPVLPAQQGTNPAPPALSYLFDVTSAYITSLRTQTLQGWSLVIESMVNETLSTATALAEEAHSPRSQAMYCKTIGRYRYKVNVWGERGTTIVGSLEGYTKILKHELHGAEMLETAASEKLFTPPSYILDLGGVRVLVVALVNTSSKCMAGSEDVRLGVQTEADIAPDNDNHPHPVIARPPPALTVELASVAATIHLSGHWAERLHRRRFLHTPIDMTVYRYGSGGYGWVALKTRRVVPPSAFGFRNENYLVSRVRRELLALHNVALSSDALSPFGDNRRNWHDGKVRSLSAKLLSTLPAISAQLDDELTKTPDTKLYLRVATAGGLLVFLHKNGCNCRLMGLILSHCTSKAAATSLQIEMVARTFRSILHHLHKSTDVEDAFHMLFETLDGNDFAAHLLEKYPHCPSFVPSELPHDMLLSAIGRVAGLSYTEGLPFKYHPEIGVQWVERITCRRAPWSGGEDSPAKLHKVKCHLEGKFEESPTPSLGVALVTMKLARKAHGMTHKFRYISHTGSTILLDISQKALQPWNVHFGMMLSQSEDGGSPSIVLGVYQCRLWRQEDGVDGARSFHVTTFRELMERYCSTWVGDTLPLVRKKRRAARCMKGLAPTGVLRLGSRGFIQRFVTTPHLVKKYGFNSGDVLQYTRTPLRGVTTTVLGYFNAVLWVHDDTEGFPKPLQGSSFHEIQSTFGFRLLGKTTLQNHPTDSITVEGQQLRVAYRVLNKYGVQHSQIVQFTNGEFEGKKCVVLGVGLDALWVDMMCSKTPLTRIDPRMLPGKVLGTTSLPVSIPDIQYAPLTYPVVPHGDIKEFDTRTSACLRFGVFHSQRFKIVRDRYATCMGTVIGVRDNMVWGHIDGAKGASVLDKGSLRILAMSFKDTVVKPAALPRQWRRLQGALNMLGSNILEKKTHFVKRSETPKPVLDRQRNDTGVRCLSVIGEVLKFYTSYEICAKYGYHFGQLVEVDGVEGTIIGVALGELWWKETTSLACKPLAGGNKQTITANHTVIIKGIAPDFTEFYDSLMHPTAVVLRSNTHASFLLPEIAYEEDAEGALMGLSVGKELLAFNFMPSRIIELASIRLPDGSVARRYTEGMVPTATVAGVSKGELWVRMDGCSYVEPIPRAEVELWTVVQVENKLMKSKSGDADAVRRSTIQGDAMLLVQPDVNFSKHFEPCCHIWEYQNPGKNTKWKVFTNWQDIDDGSRGGAQLLTVHDAALRCDVTIDFVKLTASVRGSVVDDRPVRKREAFSVVEYAKAMRFVDLSAGGKWHSLLCEKIRSAYQATHMCQPREDGTRCPVLEKEELMSIAEPVVSSLFNIYKIIVEEYCCDVDPRKVLRTVAAYSPVNRLLLCRWVLLSHGIRLGEGENLEKAALLWGAYERYKEVTLSLPPSADLQELIKGMIEATAGSEMVEREKIRNDEIQEAGVMLVVLAQVKQGCHKGNVYSEVALEEKIAKAMKETVAKPAPLAQPTAKQPSKRTKQNWQGGEVRLKNRHDTHVYVDTTGDIYFDITPEACQPFGYEAGDLVRCGFGDLKGNEAIILGVNNAALWRYDVSTRRAHPFEGTSKRDIDRRHNLQVVSSKHPLPRHDPFPFVLEDSRVEYFDISSETLQEYGLHHGERYAVDGHGVVTVIGQFEGTVWFASDWSGAFTIPGFWDLSPAILYATTVRAYQSKEKLSAKAKLNEDTVIALDITKHELNKHSVVLGAVVEHHGEECPVCGVQRGTVYVMVGNTVTGLEKGTLSLTGEVIDVPVEHIEFKEDSDVSSFRYLGPSGAVRTFDRKPGNLRLWGVQANDIIQFGAGIYEDSTAIVVGIREGHLWVDFNNGIAVPITAPTAKAFRADYLPQAVGSTELSPYLG